MELLLPFLSDLIAGLVGAGILAALVFLSRRVGPEQWQQWAGKLRRLAWPLLTLVFFATALTSSIVRGDMGSLVLVLGAFLVVAAALVILPRLGPAKIRRLEAILRSYAWPILTGIFFLTTVTLFFVGVERSPLRGRIVFVVDIADEEMIALRGILDELEPDLGSEVFLMNVDCSRYVARLDKMAASGGMKWDLIAVDNNMLGLLGAKGLVEELSKYIEYDKLIPRSLLPSLRPLLKFEGRFYFVPFRPNVKITFYNERKFTQYGLEPPKNWDQLLEVARVFKEKEGVGRVAIQGYPGKTTAVTVFEFVQAAGGNPLALDDEGSRRAFTFLQQLEPYLAREYVETRFDTANELLIGDEVYLVCNWSYAIKVIVEDAGKTEIKAYSGWKGPEREVHVLGGDFLAVPKGAPHPNQAAKLMELLLSKEIQQKLVSSLRWPPARLDAYDVIPPTLAPYFRAVNEALSLAVARPAAPQWTLLEKALDRTFAGLIKKGNDISFLEEHCGSLKKVPTQYIPYQVAPGDSLEVIARRHNTTVPILVEANYITSRKSLSPGQILLVPR